MIIHLEAEWDDAVLERFALVIAQQSLHFALQLNWILQGAIEDYQPELPDGEPNPNFNFLYYSRCTKLLTNMERCVVYRRPRSRELQKMYEQGKITKEEYQVLVAADRKFNAVEVTGERDGPSAEEIFGGTLLYKRKERTACWKPKPWKTRYFCVEENMLNCYNVQGGTLVRSMPLEGATVEPVMPAKYDHMFRVANRNFEFKIRATSSQEMKTWVKRLQEESTSTAVFGRRDQSLADLDDHEETNRVLGDLTPAQRARFDFFRNERDFVRRLTDIAEELRFRVPADRKKKAPKMLKHLEIPPCVYVPLCNSTDIWRRVSMSMYKDTRVFNTNERCPVIMYFLATRGELPGGKTKHGKKCKPNLDVAEFMHLGYEVFEDQKQNTIKEEGSDDDVSLDLEGEADAAQLDAMYGTGSGDQGDISSAIWHESTVGQNKDPSQPGNKHLSRFLRESVTQLPRKIAHRLEQRRPSLMDTATEIQSVPILEGQGMEKIGNMSFGENSRSSILGSDGVIHGDPESEIDQASLNRAKKIVSGGESWAEKSKRMLEEAKNAPPAVDLEIVSLMSKSNDDLRQEVFVMQMLHFYKSVFAKAKLPLKLRTYRILSTSSTTGLIEVLTDATSIDGLKKADGYPKEGGLRRYFEETYGGPDNRAFKAAQSNFMHSLAAYSLVAYLLGLKDRHNGNIMIDTHGNLIHIDFGFAMGMAPGHEFSMERAPFKFTQEYLDVMGGPKSKCYAEFKRLFVEGFKQARANSQIALGLVEIMMFRSRYPCFSGWRYGNGISLRRFEQRLMLGVRDDLVEGRARALVDKALNHSGTRLYDAFQQHSNGYAI